MARPNPAGLFVPSTLNQGWQQMAEVTGSHKKDRAYDPSDITRIKPVRQLTEAEVANMNTVKSAGREFYDLVASMPSSREISLAKTKIEEAVMWAVKGITE
jgi:hypothetical protein